MLIGLIFALATADADMIHDALDQPPAAPWQWLREDRRNWRSEGKHLQIAAQRGTHWTNKRTAVRLKTRGGQVFSISNSLSRVRDSSVHSPYNRSFPLSPAARPMLLLREGLFLCPLHPNSSASAAPMSTTSSASTWTSRAIG